MDFFKIGEKTIKAPSEITVSSEILDKEERTVDGTMVVDIIGVKRKADVSWEYLSKEDMAILADACRHDKFTTVSFHDGATGQLISMKARAEGLTYMPHYDWAKSKLMWKSVTVSFKEK